eukprot:8658284-Lingulodinium_polyedra.AAC.1
MPSRSEVAIVLPASKTDTQAHGVRRSLRCSCDARGAASAADHPLVCPACAVKAQVACITLRFGELASAGLPLFPTLSGECVPKADMVATI